MAVKVCLLLQNIQEDDLPSRKYAIAVKKIHRLKTPDRPLGLNGTLCGRTGYLLYKSGALVIRENDIDGSGKHGDGVLLKWTDTDTAVTCVSCVRVIIGIPQKPRTRNGRYFRSKHLRTALHPLGLLKRN